MRQRHGIAGLPAYQEGGLHVPQEDIPLVVPDTLTGADRDRMMRWLHRLSIEAKRHEAPYGLRGDTTQVSQGGIGDFLRSDEARDFMELISELRGGSPVSTETFHAPTYLGGHWVEKDQKIRMNIGNTMLNQFLRHRKGRYDPDTRRGGGYPVQTAGAWEETPAEDFLRTLYHEGHHSIDPYGQKRAGVLDPDQIPFTWYNPYAEIEGAENVSPYQQRSDDFGAVLEAVRNAEPGDSREDVLREAQRLYWDISTTGYKFKRLEETKGSYTGEGSYSDPMVVDPEFLEAMRPEQAIQMEPHLDLILGTEKYKDHPLNIYDRLSRGEKIRRGIASLFSRLLGRNEP